MYQRPQIYICNINRTACLYAAKVCMNLWSLVVSRARHTGSDALECN